MPPIARSFVKAAFLYFVAAFLLGALMSLDRWLNFSRWLKLVYLGQLHLLVVGWLTQLAVGVAYWMFPRLRKEQDPRPRGSDTLAWFVLVCLNVGLLLRFVLEPFYLMGPQPWLAASLALSGLLQAAAVVAFGLLIWARIRPMES
jgi:cbb3-type cytochrome oxidase subunit 1